MKRTQLYLDDSLWDLLHLLARNQNTTVSELVRVAARERYMGDSGRRKKALLEFIGSRTSAADATSAVDEVRQLRRGSRLDRLSGR